MSNSKRTTTTRKGRGVSAPMRYLIEQNLIDYGCPALDYGCGLGDDVRYIRHQHAYMLMFGYDPYQEHLAPWFTRRPREHFFKTITCIYVLNVVSKHTQYKIMKHIKSLLRKNGTAYLVVRRDIKNPGIQPGGTLQRNVVLRLPVLYERKGRFCIYEMKKGR